MPEKYTENLGVEMPPPTKYSCNKGHTWESTWFNPTLPFGIYLGGDLKVQIDDLCPFCLKEKLDELLFSVGRAERVDDTPPEPHQTH